MAQLVKCVPWKHGDPDSVSQNPYKNLAEAAYSCNISTWGAGDRRSLASLVTSPAELRVLSQNTGEGGRMVDEIT